MAASPAGAGVIRSNRPAEPERAGVSSRAVRFCVLGPLVVHGDDGADVTPGGPQQRKVLAILAMAAPRPVAVEHLTDALWPHGAPSTNALQAQISKLRRALPGITIAGDQRGYALVLGADHTTDAIELERLLRPRSIGTTVTDATDTDQRDIWSADAVERYRAATALVRGEPLAELIDSDVANGERARLTALASAARAGLVDAYIDAARLDEAAACLEELVATDPLDERWWARLMRVQYRQGRPVDALASFGRARRLLADELGLEPGPELRQLEEQVLRHDPALLPVSPNAAPPTPAAAIAERQDHHGPWTRRRTVLPTRLTSLLGRDELLAELDVQLASARLISLVGPGGVGKTSVALELARNHAGASVALVELAALDSAEAVLPAIGDALGLTAADVADPAEACPTQQRIIEALHAQPTLLVLDNCEHLVEAVAKTVRELLEAGPPLVVLATTRESLGVPGEVVRPIPPLPDDVAVDLFVERARAAAPELDLGGARDDIAAICARLDGLPLAIELAAARARTMDPTELLARLDDRFGVLGTGSRTLERRQQTLRAVVDWSHDRLDDAERRVLRRLAAFRGGASLAAAEVVTSDDDLPPTAIAGVLDRLIDKSLVVRGQRDGESRYTMLQTIGDYAVERLRESGELERVLDRHARHVAATFEAAERGLIGPEQGRWIRRVATEWDNVAAALDVAIARGDGQLALRLTVPLGWYFYMVAQAEVGAAALESALACPGPTDPALRATALAHYGWLVANGSRVDVALSATAEAVDLMAGVDDPWTETFVYATRIMALLFSGREAEGVPLLAATHQAAARSDERWSVALATLIAGTAHQLLGESDRADAEFVEAIALLDELGDEFGLMLALGQAAELAELRGEYHEARDMLQRGIATAERVGFSSKPMAMRAHLANVEMLCGDLDTAERMHRELLAGLTGVSLPWVRGTVTVGLAAIARRRGRLDEAERWLEDAWEQARERPVPLMWALVYSGQGYTADQRGDPERALALQLKGVDVAAGVTNPRVLASSFEGVAGALAAGDAISGHETAARLLGRADALRRGSGGAMPPGERYDVDRAEGRARAALGSACFDDLFSTGASATTDALLAEARSSRA